MTVVGAAFVVMGGLLLYWTFTAGSGANVPKSGPPESTGSVSPSPFA